MTFDPGELRLERSYDATDDRLNRFFVPVLSESVRYDRVSGYYSSHSLVHVARGLSRFIANESQMRLIVGADLADDDVAAIEAGRTLEDVLATQMLNDPLSGEGIITDHRLEVLGWMLREGRLEIKVGVPTDKLGRPLSRAQSEAYFHAKYGVFTDAEGQRVAFLGSNNETGSGHVVNHESFAVYTDWESPGYVDDTVAKFARRWRGDFDDPFTVVDLPEAVAERLIARVKHAAPPPPEDPEETPDEADSDADALRLAFVAAAPRIAGGTGVGFATAAVEPWPHQTAIARQAVETFPRSYLLADQVGLGKTIEAGLILRELLVSGRADSALLLVPASVIRQWQEELDEKFALTIPRYDSGRFYTRQAGVDVELPNPGGNPWAAFPVLLASSHLARRRTRRSEIISAGPWDVVLVDEAHHARRSGSKSTDTPNTLMALLADMKLNRSWKALYLASATPMQMNPHEAWDLLELLGLTPLWGESANKFTQYYSELREEPDVRQWEFLRRMSEDFFTEGSPDPVLTSEVRSKLGLAGSKPIRDFHKNGLSNEAKAHLDAKTFTYLDEWLRRHTPMRDRVFRTTRTTLRHYKETGLLDASATIPVRSVKDRFVPFSEEEAALYDRIEAYISKYYDAYMSGPGANKPLGFIMTVYRRRLTSSFLAIQRSLERRRDVLVGNAAASGLLDPDDVAALEYTALFDVANLPDEKVDFVAEVAELDSFIEDLRSRPPDESKMTYLHNELHDAFHGLHDTAIVFTQYADTMDYIRNQLVPVYGERVACWSGAGGERWSSETETWEQVSKAELKRLFREGKDVKILIGTDSMSEGLNLQTCGLLVNYDMPWNFMRVEQRIGRVDRIGGRPEIDIRNFFYEGSIEEQIYTGIAEDMDWFEDIVGPAQPVLGRVEDVIERVAMQMPNADREQAVVAEVAAIRAAIEQAKAQAVTIDDVGRNPELGTTNDTVPAIDLAGLEQVLTRAQPVAQRFHPHPSIAGAYLLEVGGEKVPVSFRRKVIDEHPGEVRLLTYGTKEMSELLNTLPGTPLVDFGSDDPTISSLGDLDQKLATGLLPESRHNSRD